MRNAAVDVCTVFRYIVRRKMAEDAEVGGLEADNQLQDLNLVQVREAARKKGS